MMNVLGIETSCDETSVAVVAGGRKLLSNVTASSLKFHSRHGGIIPEIAFRMQLETIVGVAQDAVRDSKLSLKDIGLIAVTSEPGLLGSLVVGVSFAKALALSLKVPLIGVNHLHSHIYANFLDAEPVQLPFIGLIVSGGHTSLYHVHGFNRITSVGHTVDDACGEAFDKVAKILRLGYPGGPVIERLAATGDPGRYPLKCALADRPYDFSFSGIKTAVLYLSKHEKMSMRFKRDVAASFQKAVAGTLIKKTLAAAKARNVKRIAVGGGVAANSYLRQEFLRAVSREGLQVYFPPKSLCLDNAAMVAGMGYRLYREGLRSGLDLEVNLN